MKINLISKPDKDLSATAQIMVNRGLAPKDFKKYFNTTNTDINEPTLLDNVHQGAQMLMRHIAEEDNILVVVDSDCDGFTSAALIINYICDMFPSYEDKIDWFMHEGKQHGLSDCAHVAEGYNLVILPDSSSNDSSYHHILHNESIDILVLDHHEAEDPDYMAACIINNQLCDYPNKELSGVGVTWQFCRYIDSISGNNYADNYLDLVALGNMADMMSLLSIETKHLIFKGFQAANIHNPFIFEMANKNSFSLNKPDYKPSEENGMLFSPMGAAFFIAPLVNAIVRSGTIDEKNLVFSSMLKFKAFEMIPSTKRGHKEGEKERLVDQAIRTCTNVKNRQTKAQDNGLEYLEHLIEENNMLEHKMLLFLLEPGMVDKNIAGLIANKFMAKYQRPCAILTKVEEKIQLSSPHSIYDENIILDVDVKQIKISYAGSARGYGDIEFKDICAAGPGVNYAEGHQGAFGLSLNAAGIQDFVQYIDEKLQGLVGEPAYNVDYIWEATSVDGDKILEIANMNDYWGKDIERSLVCIKGLKVNEDNFKVMKSNTLKFTTPNNISIIKFGGTEKEIDKFSTSGYIEIDCICKCNANEWNGTVSPQLMMEDYEIVGAKAYFF